MSTLKYLHASIRLGLESSPGTNTLAYFCPSGSDDESKDFMTLTPGCFPQPVRSDQDPLRLHPGSRSPARGHEPGAPGAQQGRVQLSAPRPEERRQGGQPELGPIL
jgi:hypothetical protein